MALFSVLCSSKQPLSAGIFLEKVVRYTNNPHHPLHELGSCEMSHCTSSTLMDLDGSGLPTKIGCACRQPVLNDWGSYLRFMGFITTCGFKLLYHNSPLFSHHAARTHAFSLEEQASHIHICMIGKAFLLEALLPVNLQSFNTSIM